MVVCPFKRGSTLLATFLREFLGYFVKNSGGWASGVTTGVGGVTQCATELMGSGGGVLFSLVLKPVRLAHARGATLDLG